MAVRNMAAGRDIKESILKEIPNARVETMELDLSSLVSVKQFAGEFVSSGRPLNILMNQGTPFQLSKDNIELHFATNHLGHFLLTSLLLDTMKQTYQATKKEGRIVTVSSEGHRCTFREGVRFDRINDPKWYISFLAYFQSKIANILHANELARRLKEDGVEITANSVHPGVVTTNMFRHLGIFEGSFNNLLCSPASTSNGDKWRVFC
ncbi:OLC1v1027452C1 [Oldenlandia corymbosa var. corymbosa]|nr:OLC1v1027452C1 [Oldenlandia corymbosa var. corymbosa]